ASHSESTAARAPRGRGVVEIVTMCRVCRSIDTVAPALGPPMKRFCIHSLSGADLARFADRSTDEPPARRKGRQGNHGASLGEECGGAGCDLSRVCNGLIFPDTPRSHRAAAGRLTVDALRQLVAPT